MALDFSNYDPYETNTQQSQPSIKSALFSTAKTMAAFGILNMAGRAIWSGMSMKAAGAIARYNIGGLGTIARDVGAKSVGKILQNTSAGKVFAQGYKKAVSPFTTALAERSQVIAAARATGPMTGAVSSFTSMFKSPKTLIGTVGRSWKHNVLGGTLVTYAIDSALGVTKQIGLDEKKWYDVPGQIGNYAKWLAYDTANTLGFRAGLKTLKASGGALGVQAGKVFKGSLGKSIVKGLTASVPGLPKGSKVDYAFNEEVKAFAESNYQNHFVSRAMHGTMTFGKSVAQMTSTINNTMTDIAQNVKERFTKSDINSIRNKRILTDPIRKALSNIKEIWATNRKHYEEYSAATHHGIAALEWAEEVSGKLRQHKFKGGIGEVLKSFGEMRAQHDKTNFVDEIFGLEPLRNKDIVTAAWRKEKHDLFKQTLSVKDSDQLMDHIMNMRVSPGHYKAHGSSIRGGGVNLGMFDPVHLLKKATSAVLLKPYHIPFTGININLGNMLGQGTWGSDAPAVTYWGNTAKDRRSYKLGERTSKDLVDNKLAHYGAISTSDITSNVWNTTYINGRLALFTEDGNVHSVEWGRKLMFDYGGGGRRRNENAWMKNRHQLLGREMTEPSLERVSNKWLQSWLDPKQLTMPTQIKGLFNKVTSALKGKNTEYQELGGLFSKDYTNPHEWHRYSNVMQNLRLHAGQEIIHVLKDKESLKVIADVNHAVQFGDAYDVLKSSRSLRQRILDNELGDPHWLEQVGKRGIHEEVEMLKVYPGQADKHIVTKQMGLSRDLTANDRIRLEYIDDIFGTAWKNEPGRDHPLVAAIPELLKRGHINQSQAQAIKVFGHLSAFADTGLLGPGFKPQEKLVGGLIKDARIKLKNANANVENEISEYIQKRKFRTPTLVKTLIEQYESAVPYNKSAYVSVPDIKKHPLAFLSEAADSITDSVTDMASQLVLPFKKDPIRHFGLKGNMAYLSTSAVKIAGAVVAFKTVDALLASNPLFDRTALDNGVTGIVADAFAAGRLTSSRALDALGITGVAKHLNGLMPGFTTSAPGALAGAVVSRSLGGGPVEMMKWFAGGALANRMLAPYLPDFTKTYEQLKAEYDGKTEVPIMKSPTWLLGATPWEGQKVEGYTPNWYVRTKSRWKETDSLYGSTFRKLLHEPLWPLGISLGDFVDPYFMERKHFFSRPYPTTGGLGEEVPLVGPLIAGTLGRIIKPKKTMHQEFLAGPDNSQADDTYPFANPPPTLREGTMMMKHDWGVRRAGGRSTLMGTFQYASAKPWSTTMAEDTLYNIQNFAGLKGFLAGTISDRLFNTPTVIPTLETAGRIASQSRSYQDANLGGMGILSEPIRRIIQKPEYKKYGINPIPNMMPDWLPQEFLTGDPFAKIVRGELRLPGAAYARTHTNLMRTMPARASMIGAPEEHMVQYFTGLLSPMLKEEYDILGEGTTMHAQVQDSLAAEGLLIQAEKLVYDAKRDITGHVDAIIKDGMGGKGRRALEIKTINSMGFEKLDAPKNQHVSQLNFYLKQLGMYKGTLLYINRDNPSQVKTYEIKYSKTRYERDMAKLDKTRQVATDMMGEGVGDRFGYSYSWLDRLKILSDVAPLSDQFKEAKNIVQQQIKSNLLTPAEVTDYKTALKHKQARIRRYELYPLRFKGKVMSPNTEANIQSINEDIKGGQEYSLVERAVGSIWERFTNSNNFLSNKFFAFKDPLEHYKTLKLYGKEYKPWDDPWGSFAEPTLRTVLAQQSLAGGGYKFGVVGYSLGGPVGALAGSVLGSVYGTVNGLWRGTNDSVYIPGIVKEQRAINQYFDAAKFERYSRMAQLSDGITRQEYQTAASTTLTALNQAKNPDVANLFRATPYMEKPYISAWLEENNPDRRQEILKMIPPDLAKALKGQWSLNDNKDNTNRFVRRTSEEVAAGFNGSQFDRGILDPSVELEDIKLKTIEDAGFNAHDFGLGWNEQQLRMQENYNDIEIARLDGRQPDSFDSPNLSPSQVRFAINEQLRNMGVNGRANVYVNAGADDVNSVNIFIKTDRAMTIANALDNRSAYLE